MNICTLRDINNSGKVEFGDFSIIAEHWRFACSAPNWYNGGDLNFSGSVDIVDLRSFVEKWME